MSEATVVRFDVEDGIGVITVDYPPVNDADLRGNDCLV